MTINYRYPGEKLVLLATFVVSFFLLLILTPFTLGGLIVVLGGGFALNYFWIRATIEGYKRSAVKVGGRNFPEIREIVNNCAERLSISASDIDVYVVNSPILNAFATGVGRPFCIVLHSELIKALSREQLSSVIGHEMGHIKFGHTSYLTIIGQLGNQTMGIPIIGSLFRYAFLLWSRKAEFSADRAGLIVSGDIDEAISTEVVLAVGPELAGKVDMAELARQARESNGNLLASFGEMSGTHPMMTSRIQEMINFVHSETFRRLRPDADVSNSSIASHWSPTS